MLIRNTSFLMLLTLLATSKATAQDDKVWAIGLSGGASFGINESQNQALGPNLRISGVWQRGLSKVFWPEFGVGFVGNSGSNPPIAYSDYANTMIPIDLRVRFVPAPLGSWSPYLYVGIGLVHWSLSTEPPNKSEDSKPSGMTAFVPVGGGIYTKLSDKWAIEVTAGWNASFTDNLNDAHDGKNDAWWHAGLTVFLQFPHINDDFDDDGLKNSEERKLGTDPRNPDTDNDGLSDGEEVLRYKTNPLNNDSDGDGISDGDEVIKYHTDPLRLDTDNDGLNDNEEIFRYHTDPNKRDTDGDGISDGDELKLYHTDPLNPDTDGDGLSDGDEVRTYKTNPLSKDTDGDGLSDGDEVHKYHTDPAKPDTDGGSVFDGVEVKRGTNPLDPSDDVLKQQK